MQMSPQKRLIAALLPFSFLWVVMACVSICERETLAVHSPTNLSTSVEINVLTDTTDCDGCPLSFFPKATTPEQPKSIVALEMSSGFASILFIYSHLNDFSDRLDIPVSNGSPPLKLLSTLRI